MSRFFLLGLLLIAEPAEAARAIIIRDHGKIVGSIVIGKAFCIPGPVTVRNSHGETVYQIAEGEVVNCPMDNGGRK